MTRLLEWISQIFIEQTSALEMIIFIFVVVMVCMSFAALLYIALMFLIWAVWLPAKQVGLRRVFLPSPRQFREYAGEYVLAMSTSVLLATTTVVKHGLIEQIKSWPAEGLPGLANLFPLHTVPEAVENLTGEITLSSLLKPALDAGESDRVRVVVQGLIEQELVLPSWGGLLLACGLIIVAHLSWLASRRYVLLAKSPETDGKLGYGKTARSLFVLAVCVALLLAAPSMTADPERLATSSMAALRGLDRESVEYYDEISRAIDEQRQDLRILEGARNQVLDPEMGAQGSVWSAIADRLDGHDQSISRLYTRMDSAATGISGLDSRLADIGGRLDGLMGRLDNLDQSVTDLRTSLASTEAEIGAIGTRLTDVDSRLADIEGRFGSHERLINGLLTSFTAMEAQMEAISRRLTELDGQYGSLVGLIDGIRERLAGLFERVGRLEGLHRESGLLIVSGTPGTRFSIRERNMVAEVPAVIDLAPGLYTLVLQAPERTAVATLAQPPVIMVQVLVEPDKATGVTLPPIGDVR